MTLGSYLEDGLNPIYRAKVVTNLVTVLKRVEFDTIVCRGVSGLMMAPILGHLLNKPITIIRKEGEGAHSSRDVEGETRVKSYVIVDDFISTGSTIETIIVAMQKHLDYQLPNLESVKACRGVFTYAPDRTNGLDYAFHFSIYDCAHNGITRFRTGNRRWGLNRRITDEVFDKIIKGESGLKYGKG